MGSWDDTCTGLLVSHPELSQVCISGNDGQVYGTSSQTDFLPTAGHIKELCTAIRTSVNNSIEVCGDKYIILRNENPHLIGKCGPKSLFVHLTGKLLILGISVDSDGHHNSGIANSSIIKIAEYYISEGW